MSLFDNATVSSVHLYRSFCSHCQKGAIHYTEHQVSIQVNHNHVDDEMLNELRGQLAAVPDTISFPSNTTFSNEALLAWIYAAKRASEIREGRDYVVEKLEDNFVKIIPLSFRGVPELDASFANQKMEALLLAREMPWELIEKIEKEERKLAVKAALTLSQLEKGVPVKNGKSTKKRIPEDVTEYISEFFPRSEAIRKGIKALRDQDNDTNESKSDISPPKSGR